MKGTEFLEIAKKSSPHTPRIMVTAYQNAEMMEASINKAEVFRFLTKPIDIEVFLEKEENHKILRDCQINCVGHSVKLKCYAHPSFLGGSYGDTTRVVGRVIKGL